MKGGYFADVTTLDDATATYHALARQYHPDVCGKLDAGDIMAAINAEYRELMGRLASNRREDPKSMGEERPAASRSRMKPSDQSGNSKKPQRNKGEGNTRPKRKVVSVPVADANRLWEKAEDLLTDVLATGIREGIKKLRRSR